MTGRRAIGLMAGSSCDGLDIVAVEFAEPASSVRILASACPSIDLPLRRARDLSARDLQRLHVRFGRWMGEHVKAFVDVHALTDLEVVASHGFTVWHDPADGHTTQIGHGAYVAGACGVPVVCDLRSADLAHGGQGAPVVPLAESVLWPDHDAFLNLGGIANIARHDAGGSCVAYDLTACNQVLDRLVDPAGGGYDAGGRLAASGAAHADALNALDELAYMRAEPPKSLDNGFSDRILSELEHHRLSQADALATMVEHIAHQVARAADGAHRILVTGGGAHNTTLVDAVRRHAAADIMVPDASLIDFKEAVVMAWMGLRRLDGLPNVHGGATGASRSTVGGTVYSPI